MLSQLSISICAVMLIIASPMLHYWGSGSAVAEQSRTSCCSCHHAGPMESPEVPAQSEDWSWDCECYTRVAVQSVRPCDIAELADKCLPGNDSLVALYSTEDRAELGPWLLFDAPVHFGSLSDAREFRAHLGRYLL